MLLDIATYLNRITSQHKTKPKFMAFLAARLQPFIDLATCLASFDAAFDLDQAVGKQLDTIGEYVGVKRLLNFQPYYDAPVLQDRYYRMLIKAKISLNNWDGTGEGISRILGNVFPQYTVTVVDNQNMTLNVQIAGLESLFDGELITHGHITPKPMGVFVDYYYVFNIELKTALYLGGLAHARMHNSALPELPPPSDNLKPTGDLCMAGLRSDNRVGSSIMHKPQPTDIVVAPGQACVAGMELNNIVGSATQSKPMPTEIEPPLIDDYTHAGLFSSKRISTAIAEKPTMCAFDTLRIAAYKGGIMATSTLRYALPSASV